MHPRKVVWLCTRHYKQVLHLHKFMRGVPCAAMHTADVENQYDHHVLIMDIDFSPLRPRHTVHSLNACGRPRMRDPQRTTYQKWSAASTFVL